MGRYKQSATREAASLFAVKQEATTLPANLEKMRQAVYEQFMWRMRNEVV